MSPFVNETNEYINRIKSVLLGAGFQVKPFSFRTLLSSDVWGLLDDKNLVLMHWMESRVFTEGRGGAKVRSAGLLQFLIYVTVILFMRAKLVYFVHDHAVHDLTGWRRMFSKRLIALLGGLASLRVVHDPSFAQYYKAIYLPHPLYVDREQRSPNPVKPPEQALVAGALGAVRPYKRIEDIIAIWPPGPLLVIRGRADAAYEEFLRQAIHARQDTISVDLKTGFLSRESFMAEMARLDALILPHADASMLVSGAFFEAIGAVPFVIARETPFTRWASGQFPGVLTFTTDAELLAQLTVANQMREQARLTLASTAAKANELFGQAACVRMYGDALRQV